MNPVVTAHLRSASFADLGDLSGSHRRTWQAQHSDCGFGALDLQNDDGDLAAAGLGAIVQMEVGGVAVFAWVVEQRSSVVVTEGEEVDQVTTLSGRGTMALWEQMVVYPEKPLGWNPVADNRVFNLSADLFDDSSWVDGVVTFPEIDPVDGLCHIGCGPGDWPDPFARWIWDRYVGEVPAPVVVPLGKVFFRQRFTTTAVMTVELWAVADDAYQLWIDNVLVLTDPGPGVRQPRTTRIRLSPGDHLIAVEAENQIPIRGWLLYTMLEVTSEGALNPVAITNTAQDLSIVILAYPPMAPGFTPGKILRILLQEAQARGALTTMTLGFSDTLDSSGAAWAVLPDVSFRCGLDGLSVLRQLAASYIDCAMAPDALRLDAWNKGGMGGPSGVTLAPGVNLTELSHEEGR